MRLNTTLLSRSENILYRYKIQRRNPSDRYLTWLWYITTSILVISQRGKIEHQINEMSCMMGAHNHAITLIMKPGDLYMEGKPGFYFIFVYCFGACNLQKLACRVGEFDYGWSMLHHPPEQQHSPVLVPK